MTPRLGIADLLRAQHVKRWTTVQLSHDQSLAEHSFNVAILAMELASRIFKDVEDVNSVGAYALAHDVDEIITGDIPTPTKRRLQEVSPKVDDLLTTNSRAASVFLEETEHLDLVMKREIIKIADAIETAFHVKQFAVGVHACQVACEVEAITHHKMRSLESSQLRKAAFDVWDELHESKRVW